MSQYTKYGEHLRSELKKISSSEVAKASQRYSSGGLEWVGVRAGDIKLIVKEFHTQNSHLSANDVLSISEEILACAKYSEEVFVAFGLLDKFVKNNYQDDLLFRFEYWLENYACNWGHVDILCIKTIYLFLMARPHLIEETQVWSKSEVSWCRRASNVVWVKFIRRKIGKTVYCLDTRLVFKNCNVLMKDPDEFVQKSIGWLLKVTSVHHENDVVEYIRANHRDMPRSTIRYALEKVDKELRKNILLELSK